MEYLDIVNDQDEVIGTVPRSEAYVGQKSGANRYRIATVFMFNDEGKMALQLRSKNLSFSPHTWCATACGHVSSGETFEQAAMRELAEEAGISTKLEFVGKALHDPESHNKFVVSTFKGIWNKEFHPHAVDVEKVEFYSLDEVKSMTEREEFHPQTIVALKKYFLV